MHSTLLLIITLVASGLALITALIALFFSLRIRTWRKYFRTEQQPENLEDIITSIAGKLKVLEEDQHTQAAQIIKNAEILTHAVQHVGMVRFNSLADEGGNLSFALALIDANRNGTIITSLHGRQGNRLYTKKVVGGSGETSLSDEEQDALFQALQPHTPKE